MTRDETILEMCKIVGIAYHSIGDYSEPSDGFCDLCPASRQPGRPYRNAGKAIAYVRAAVIAKLKADGYSVKEIS